LPPPSIPCSNHLNTQIASRRRISGGHIAQVALLSLECERGDPPGVQGYAWGVPGNGIVLMRQD
tara:strand:- start:351 stop:542 length:192 start_codon:yes stop_codon:yes gene_type:complete